jgi:hypothetical protein
MLASTRRTRRSRSTLAALAALSLGLAACGADDDTTSEDDVDTEVEAPADDGLDEDAPEDGVEDPEAAPPAFEDLEEGELVPGVYMDVPVDETLPVQAQPTPVGSAYVAALTDQTGAVSLNVEFDGQDLDQLLEGIDALVESGQAEVTAGPDEIEIEGAEEATRVELSAPEGGATATGLFAIADGHAISIAIEVTDGADIDVEAMIESLRIDAERLEMAGTAEMPDGGEAPDGTAPDGDAADDGSAPDDVEDGAEDGGEGDTEDDAAVDPDDEG